MSVGAGPRRVGGHLADGMVVGRDMELEEAGPRTWSTGAVEDAADAIDMLANGLAAIDPETARILAAVPAATARLRSRLVQASAEDVPEVPAPRSDRPRRRGLSPGWQGVRLPDPGQR